MKLAMTRNLTNHVKLSITPAAQDKKPLRTGGDKTKQNFRSLLYITRRTSPTPTFILFPSPRAYIPPPLASTTTTEFARTIKYSVSQTHTFAISSFRQPPRCREFSIMSPSVFSSPAAAPARDLVWILSVDHRPENNDNITASIQPNDRAVRDDKDTRHKTRLCTKDKHTEDNLKTANDLPPRPISSSLSATYGYPRGEVARRRPPERRRRQFLPLRPSPRAPSPRPERGHRHARFSQKTCAVSTRDEARHPKHQTPRPREKTGRHAANFMLIPLTLSE